MSVNGSIFSDHLNCDHFQGLDKLQVPVFLEQVDLE